MLAELDRTLLRIDLVSVFADHIDDLGEYVLGGSFLVWESLIQIQNWIVQVLLLDLVLRIELLEQQGWFLVALDWFCRLIWDDIVFAQWLQFILLGLLLRRGLSISLKCLEHDTLLLLIPFLLLSSLLLQYVYRLSDWDAGLLLVIGFHLADIHIKIVSDQRSMIRGIKWLGDIFNKLLDLTIHLLLIFWCEWFKLFLYILDCIQSIKYFDI